MIGAVFLAVLVLVIVVGLALRWRAGRRERSTPQPAPLESNAAREAVRSAIERRLPDR